MIKLDVHTWPATTYNNGQQFDTIQPKKKLGLASCMFPTTLNFVNQQSRFLLVSYEQIEKGYITVITFSREIINNIKYHIILFNLIFAFCYSNW